MALAAIVYAVPTYKSLTTIADKDGYSGFREQVMHVPRDKRGIKSDISISYAAFVPHDAGLIGQTSEEAYRLNLEDINWCTNGTLKVKIYVPPHLSEFKIAMQYFPINYGLGFATYRPLGVIDEKHAETKSQMGARKYYDEFWHKGTTVSFILSETMDINFNSYTKTKYNIDTSRGGYLYLSFTQASRVLLSARDYDSRYKIGFVIDMTFEHPFTEAMRNDVLADIPAGLTEPVEPVQHVVSRECRQGLEYDIKTESGVAVSPEQRCADTGGVFEGNVCYYLPRDQAKYDCVVTDGDTWNGERCVRQEELDCNAQSGKKWFVAGNMCLNTHDKLSTDPDSSVVPETLNLEENTTAFKIYNYEVNREGWTTQLHVFNMNATAASVQHIKVIGQSGASLGSFDFSVAANDRWDGRLFFDGSVLKLEGAADSAAGSAVKTPMSGSETEGALIFTPEVGRKADTVVEVEYGTNLSWQGQVDISAEAQACQDRGGFYSADTGQCYGASGSGTSGGGSSTSHSSSSSAASTSSVDTQAARDCQAQGGFYSADLGICIGGTAHSTSSSSSSSSVQQSSSSSSSSPAQTLSGAERVTQYLAGKSFDISGWFISHDFAEAPAAFDWVLVTKSGNVYQLHGKQPTQQSVFGWKKVYIDVSEAQRQYAMIYLGDWDHDGSGKFDWAIVNLDTHTINKLAGVTPSGTFLYLKDVEPGATIDLDVKIVDGKVYFLTKPGQSILDTISDAAGAAVDYLGDIF